MKFNDHVLMSHSFSFQNFARRLALLLLGVVLFHSSRTSAAEVVSFSALCFSPGAAPEPTFYIGNPGTRKKIEIPVTSLGGIFQANIHDGGMIDFFSNDTDERPSVSVRIPSGSRQNLLVVFYPQGSSYQARAFTLPTQGFEGGTTFAINLSLTEVAVRHGNTQQQPIKPGGQQLLTLPAGYRDPMLPVQIFSRNPAGAWEVAQSTRWPVDQRFRSYLFLYRTKESGPIGVHAVPERLNDN